MGGGRIQVLLGSQSSGNVWCEQGSAGWDGGLGGGGNRGGKHHRTSTSSLSIAFIEQGRLQRCINFYDIVAIS
jgi:hypothetical protein